MSAPVAIVALATYTKIIVNGRCGSLWLDDLGFLLATDRAAVPPVLACLVREDLDSLEVDSRLADEVALFVDGMLATRQ